MQDLRRAVRELSHGAPKVREGSSVPPGAWPVFCDGYYTAICAALKAMQIQLEIRESQARARKRASAAKRKAERSLTRKPVDSGEDLRVQFHHILELVDQSGEQAQGDLEGEGPIVVRYTHVAADNAGFSVNNDLTVDLDARKRVAHPAEYQPDLFDAQLEKAKENR